MSKILKQAKTKVNSDIKTSKESLKKVKTGSQEYTEKARKTIQELNNAFKKSKTVFKNKVFQEIKNKDTAEYVYTSNLLSLYILVLRNLLSINANSISISGYLKIVSEIVKKTLVKKGLLRKKSVDAVLVKIQSNRKAKRFTEPSIICYDGTSVKADTIREAIKRNIKENTSNVWEEFKEKVLSDDKILFAFTNTILKMYENEQNAIKNNGNLSNVLLENISKLEKAFNKIGLSETLIKVLLSNYLVRGIVYGDEKNVVNEILELKNQKFIERKGPANYELIKSIGQEIRNLNVFKKDSNKDIVKYLNGIETLIDKTTSNGGKLKKNDISALLSDIKALTVQGNLTYRKSLFNEQLSNDGLNGIEDITEEDIIKITGGSGSVVYENIDKLVLNDDGSIKFKALSVKEMRSKITKGLEIIKKNMNPKDIDNAFVLLKYNALLSNAELYTKIKNNVISKINEKIQEAILETNKENEVMDINKEVEGMKDDLIKQTSEGVVKKIAEITNKHSSFAVFYKEEVVDGEVKNSLRIVMNPKK